MHQQLLTDITAIIPMSNTADNFLAEPGVLSSLFILAGLNQGIYGLE